MNNSIPGHLRATINLSELAEGQNVWVRCLNGHPNSYEHIFVVSRKGNTLKVERDNGQQFKILIDSRNADELCFLFDVVDPEKCQNTHQGSHY